MLEMRPVMAKKSIKVAMLIKSREKMPIVKKKRPHISTKPNRPWLISIVIVGLIIFGVVSLAAWNWLKNIQLPGITGGSQPPITTLNVQRTAYYANLTFTMLNVQYAASFLDDPVQSNQAAVRINMRVTNKTSSQIGVVYYDCTHLLVPKLNSIAPTNVSLSANLKSGASVTGWLDFPIANGIQLPTLQLQLGSIHAGETLVTTPFSGTYDASRYADRSALETIIIPYNYAGHTLDFHLTSVTISYAYRGMQARAGQQFYVLNFLVDNPNGADISPGSGFDYMRLVLNGNRPPIDATLPVIFKAGAQKVGGRVAFAAPAGISSITVGLLWQVVPGQQDQNVGL